MDTIKLAHRIHVLLSRLSPYPPHFPEAHNLGIDDLQEQVALSENRRLAWQEEVLQRGDRVTWPNDPAIAN